MAFVPPGGPTDIVFSFDTTGSMSALLDEVRGRLQDMIQRLQADIPGIRVSVIAHGDYCDAEHFYVIKIKDFTDNVPELCEFVNDVGGTGGGDVAECYELVLQQTRKELTWRDASQKVLIMIGDAYPHPPDYPENVDNIDWGVQLKQLTDMGLRVYGVQAGEDPESETFFKALSTNGGGQYLKLGDFSNICTFIMAICYRERGEEFFMGYESEVRAIKGSKSIGKDLEGLFGSLRRDDSTASSVGGPNGLITHLPNPISPIPSFEIPIPKAVNRKQTLVKVKTAKKTVKRLKTNGPLQKAKVSLKSDTPVKEVEKTIKPRTTVRKPKKTIPMLDLPDQCAQRRETIPQTRFSYRRYVWSPWKLAMANSSDTDCQTGQWVKLRSCCGVRRKTLNIFNTSSKRKFSFVEVAVQPRPGARRQVVYFRVVQNVTPTTWYRVLFNNVNVREEIEHVLSGGCRVFVRRAEVPLGRGTARRVANDIKCDYDYAWHGEKRRSVDFDKHDSFLSRAS